MGSLATRLSSFNCVWVFHDSVRYTKYSEKLLLYYQVMLVMKNYDQIKIAKRQ